MPQPKRKPGNPTGKRSRLTKRQREQIVKRIRQVRSDSGMTQADFGLAVGVGQATPGTDAERSRRHSAERTVQAWETRGVVPRRETLVQIARVGERSLHWLMTGEDLPDIEGEDLESRLRSVEGKIDAAVVERRTGDGMRGGFQQVAELVASLRGEQPDVTLTALREAVASLAEQTGALVLELAALRREVAALQLSGTSGQQKRTPRAKGS